MTLQAAACLLAGLFYTRVHQQAIIWSVLCYSVPTSSQQIPMQLYIRRCDMLQLHQLHLQ